MKWSDAFGDTPVVNAGLDRITLVRARLYAGILRSRYGTFDSTVLNADCDMAIDTLRRSGYQDELPRGLLTRACLHVLQDNGEGAQVDLDEAWDIAERGPMRLHMADIHLHRARLFFREKLYPWESPQADLAAAEKLINDCGYHRRDEELADAKRAILDQAN